MNTLPPATGQSHSSPNSHRDQSDLETTLASAPSTTRIPSPTLTTDLTTCLDSISSFSSSSPDYIAASKKPQHALLTTGQPIRILHATLDVELTVEPLYRIIEGMGERILNSVLPRLLCHQPTSSETTTPRDFETEPFKVALARVVEREEQSAKIKILELVRPEAEKVWESEVKRQCAGGAKGVVADGTVVYGGDVVRVGEHVGVVDEHDAGNVTANEGNRCRPDFKNGWNQDDNVEMGGDSARVDGSGGGVADTHEHVGGKQDVARSGTDRIATPAVDASGDQEVGRHMAANVGEEDTPAGEPDNEPEIDVRPHLVTKASDLTSAATETSAEVEDPVEDPLKPYCFCSLPLNAVPGQLFGCDGPRCIWDGWFHEECVKKKLRKKDWPRREDDGKPWLCCDCGGYAARKKLDLR